MQSIATLIAYEKARAPRENPRAKREAPSVKRFRSRR